MLRRHGLNILKCKIKNKKYKRFAMKHTNDMVQIDGYPRTVLSAQLKPKKLHHISCIDDCSRKVAANGLKERE